MGQIGVYSGVFLEHVVRCCIVVCRMCPSPGVFLWGVCGIHSEHHYGDRHQYGERNAICISWCCVIVFSQCLRVKVHDELRTSVLYVSI